MIYIPNTGANLIRSSCDTSSAFRISSGRHASKSSLDAGAAMLSDQSEHISDIIHSCCKLIKQKTKF